MDRVRGPLGAEHSCRRVDELRVEIDVRGINSEPEVKMPACLAAKGACPPEDCGGPWGYADLKEALANPRREDHESMLDWLGLDNIDGFDPAACDPAACELTEINELLG
jgi:hypothetical protein